MAYEKNKSELYKAIGGINEKASNYATGDNECLKLENLDFQEPGAYTSRWGFTQSASVGTTGMMDNLWQIANNLPGYTNAGANVIASNQYSLFSVSLANGNFSNIFSSAPDAASTNTWSHAESSIFSYATNGTVGGVVPAGNTLISMVKMVNFGGSSGLEVGYFGLPRPIKHYRKGRVIPSQPILVEDPNSPGTYIETSESALINYNMNRIVKSHG